MEVPQPKGILYSRHDFVNEYCRPSVNARRLDFQYSEHDITQLNCIIVDPLFWRILTNIMTRP